MAETALLASSFTLERQSVVGLVVRHTLDLLTLSVFSAADRHQSLPHGSEDVGAGVSIRQRLGADYPSLKLPSAYCHRYK